MAPSTAIRRWSQSSSGPATASPGLDWVGTERNGVPPVDSSSPELGFWHSIAKVGSVPDGARLPRRFGWAGGMVAKPVKAPHGESMGFFIIRSSLSR